MKNDKVRVIIWGCGDYGKELYKMLHGDLGRIYQVYGLADSYYCSINDRIRSYENVFPNEDVYREIGMVYGYNDVKNLYEEDKIDGVVIAIWSRTKYKQIEELLTVMGIPIIDFGQAGIVHANEIRSDSILLDDGIEVSIVEKLDLVVRPLFGNDFGFSYLMTGENRIVAESDRYLMNSVNEYALVPPMRVERTPKLSLEKMCNLCFLGSNFNYGHFIMTVPAKIAEMEKAGYDGHYVLYYSEFAKKWIEIISDEWGIEKNRFVWMGPDDDEMVIRAEKTYVFPPLLDTGRKSATILGKMVDRIKLGTLGSSLRNVPEVYGDRKPRFLYVVRSGTRKFLDNEEILDKYDFIRIIPEELPIEEQANLFYWADVVLSPHGANATGCMFMRKGAYLIETYGSGFVDSFYVELAKNRGLRFRMLVEQRDYMERGNMDDYYIHPTLLDMTLDEIRNSIV